MPKMRIPSPLRTYANGQSEVVVSGRTAGEAMNDLTEQYPALRPHLFNGDGQLRPFVNLFLNEENIRDLQGPDTPIEESDNLILIPSIAGGKGTRA
jgi:adenylyltransferase/sulfurtransferase